MDGDVPAIRYARCGDVNIAYQRWGSGDGHAVLIPGMVSNLEMSWELPEWSRTMRRAGRAVDMVTLDKRGGGLSDRVTDPAGFETHAADVIAIMDREGVESSNLTGMSEGGVVALVAAAMFPDRVSNVTICGTPAMGAGIEQLNAVADPDDPPPSPEHVAELFRSLIRGWGVPGSPFLEINAPGAEAIPHMVEWSVRFQRQAASPGGVRDHLRSIQGFDLRPYLDRVRCPTLIVHAAQDRLNHVSHGRLLASLLGDARLWEIQSDAHAWWLTSPDWAEIQDDMDTFALGHEPDRGATTMFSAVLFTDIVDSTKRAVELGDSGWHRLVELHDAITRRAIEQRDGVVIKTTGDGVVATFSNPDLAVRAAKELQAQLDGSGIPIRAGIHIGQMELRDDGDIAGLAVNMAARIEACADSGEVLVSQAIRDMLLGTSHEFTDSGEHPLKGVEGVWRLFTAD